MNTPPALSKANPTEVLRRLQLTVNRRLDGMLMGDYQGLVPGHGSELGETRLYEPGDDVRRIDWNVTARMQIPHIRETIADRELELTLVVDLSPSLQFGTANTTKRDLLVAAASAVGMLAGRSANRIGAVIATGQGIVTLPPRSGRQALAAALHKVIVTSPPDGSGPVDLTKTLDAVARATRRRGMVVVLSDFLTPGPITWDRPLRGMAHRHEVLAIEIVDPRELELPNVGLLDLVDPETGRARTIDTASTHLRQRYTAAAQAQRQQIAGAIRRSGASHLVLRTDHDWLVELARFVASRRRRGAGLSRGGPQAARLA